MPLCLVNQQEHNVEYTSPACAIAHGSEHNPSTHALTFCSASEYTNCGRMSPLTTASARSSLWLARRPRASAAVCWIVGTTSRRRGRRSCSTPAFCKVSMFWGREARSATVCTKCVRDFWYCSNTSRHVVMERSKWNGRAHSMAQLRLVEAGSSLTLNYLLGTHLATLDGCLETDHVSFSKMAGALTVTLRTVPNNSVSTLSIM